MANTVQVTGIAKDTPEKEVRDFFSFWYGCVAMRDMCSY